MTNPANENPNPYVGPRSFRVGERIYGRKREVNQLLNLIVAERIVLLHSPSGAGKTSLIQAALIPRLAKMNFQVLPVVRVNLNVSDALAEGFECNRYVFSALLSLEEDVPEEKKVPPEWLAKMSLPDYLEQRYRPEGSMDLEVLIFDQFEEILTLDPTDQEDKEEFFKQVGEALEAPNRWALFAIRDDYVASLDPYLLWIPNRLNTNFRLDLLGIKAARRAIQEPARESGVDFEDAAAEKLADDLRRVRVQQPDGTVAPQLGPYVEPVQLQVVCFRIWGDARPDPKRITAKDLTELGQVNQSLVDRSLGDYYALQVISTAAATETSERAIREWFDRRLITEQGVRGTVLMGTEMSGGLDNKAIKELVDAHLVRAEKRAGATWYELSHDRLLEPVRESNIAWFSENLSLLQRQADLWRDEGRKGGLLLVGHTLDEAQEWAEENEEVMTQVEKDFLNASLERRKRRERVRALEQEQLEAAEKLAEEQTRSARRARRWTFAIGIIGLLFIAVAVFAYGLSVRNSATSDFIEAIVACEGGKDERCREAADSAANEENYLLLVVHACEDGLRAAVAVDEDNQELDIAVKGACKQVVEMSIDEPSSLPLLNDLCENLRYIPGSEDITRNICNQAVKLALAPAAKNLSQVYTTCAISSNVELKKDDIDAVCKRAIELMTDSKDLSSLKEICENLMDTASFIEEDINRACRLYIEVALESKTSKVLSDLCFVSRSMGFSEEETQKACNGAVDLAVEKGDPIVVRDLCLFGRSENLPEEAVQSACSGYQELSAKLAESSDDPYILSDMCLFSLDLEAGLAEEVVQVACKRAADLALKIDDPYLHSDLCLLGQMAGLSVGDIEQSCELAIISDEPYVFNNMCLSGLGAGLGEEVVRVACERAVAQAVEYDDPYLLKDLCLRAQDAGLPAEDIQQTCNLAIELADEFNNPYVFRDMCFSGLGAGLDEEDVQVACERAVELAVEFDDPNLNKELCLQGQDAGLPAGDIQQSCDLAIELAVQFSDPYVLNDLCLSGFASGLDEENLPIACDQAVLLAIENDAINLLGELCFFNTFGQLSEENLLQACELASNQILPGERRSSFMAPGSIDLLSFEGLEGQTVTIAFNAVPDNLNLNLTLLDPRGDLLFDNLTGGGNQTVLIDQLQLAESGTYIIGVNNPDSISGEYNLKFMLVEAGP